MNGYLVIGRCSMDDVPLRLFSDEKTARDYASTVTVQDVAETAHTVLDVDVGVLVLVGMVEFVEGVPFPFENLYDPADYDAD